MSAPADSGPSAAVGVDRKLSLVGGAYPAPMYSTAGVYGQIADPMRLTRYAELGCCTVCILCSSVYVSDRSAVCVNFGLLWLFCCLSSRFSLLRELCGAIIVRCSKVDLAVLFGLLAFLLNFVPNVGAVLSAPLAAASTRRSIASMHHRRSLRIASCACSLQGRFPFCFGASCGAEHSVCCFVRLHRMLRSFRCVLRHDVRCIGSRERGRAASAAAIY